MDSEEPQFEADEYCGQIKEGKDGNTWESKLGPQDKTCQWHKLSNIESIIGRSQNVVAFLLFTCIVWLLMFVLWVLWKTGSLKIFLDFMSNFMSKNSPFCDGSSCTGFAVGIHKLGGALGMFMVLFGILRIFQSSFGFTSDQTNRQSVGVLVTSLFLLPLLGLLLYTLTSQSSDSETASSEPDLQQCKNILQKHAEFQGDVLRRMLKNK